MSPASETTLLSTMAGLSSRPFGWSEQKRPDVSNVTENLMAGGGSHFDGGPAAEAEPELGVAADAHDIHDLMRLNEAPGKRQRIGPAIHQGTTFRKPRR